DGECFVDLPLVDIVDLPASPRKDVLNGAYRGCREPLRLLGMASPGDNPSKRRKAAFPRDFRLHEDDCGRSIAQTGCVAGGHRSSVRLKSWPEARQLLQVHSAGLLVDRDGRRFAGAFDRDWHQLSLEPSLGLRRQGSPVAFARVLVLISARDLPIRRTYL